MTQITVTGNLTSDPTLRFLSSGAAVASFTIAASDRVKDKDTGEYKDGPTTFFRASVWRGMAENAAESLRKGQRVIASGRMKTREYDKDGETRLSVELDVDEIGPSLRYATASVQKAEKSKPAADPWGDDPGAPF